VAQLQDIGTGAVSKDDIAAQIASMQKQLNEWGRLISNEDRTKLTKDDSGQERLLIGYQQGGFSNGSVGIKLSQTGVPVLSATNDQLIFSSDFNLFKIVASGTITAPDVTTAADGTNTNSGGATTSIAHGLNFTPLIIAFVEVSSTQYTLMPYSETVSASSPSGGIISSFYRATTSSTNISIFHYVVSYSSGIGAGTYTGARIKYYLLRETAN
jgi:hypothetical protein